MATKRLTGFVSMRLADDTRSKVHELITKHGAKGFADYFRGLLYLDAALSGRNTDAFDRPAWVGRAYGELMRRRGGQ